MANSDRCVFSLTSLQIGDLQSYLSHLGLFLAFESGKFYILVDNRPWLEDLASRSTHIWQLMVTKWRLSPFANTRGKKEKRTNSHDNSSSFDGNEANNFKKWFYLIDSVIWSKKQAMLPVKNLTNSFTVNTKLHRTLYGFIVFEVAWTDVRGINYFNELQTDTSVIIESKFMKRWEFESIEQAAKCVCTWFSGTSKERFLLEEYLNASLGEVFHDAQESFPSTIKALHDKMNYHDICQNDDFSSNCFGAYSTGLSNEMHTPPCIGPYKRRNVMGSSYCNVEPRSSLKKDSENVEARSQTSNNSDCEEATEAALYRDVLISLRFNDCDLPFKLKDIIMSELRLLTLLEAGLPSWVIFFQSYPLICNLYRPWMCPLARAVYVLISIVTVLIGFYDLYKNVPLLTATASHLFGPLFDWIETWEMISRIKYLGTMLFLHNVQKAMRWFFTLARITRSFFSFFIKPIARPFIAFLQLFLPLWSVYLNLVNKIFSVTWTILESFFTVVGDLIEIMLLPLWFVSLILGNFVSSFVYPILWILTEITGSLVRLVLCLSNLVVSFGTYMYALVVNVRAFASGLFQFTRSVESTVTSVEVSMWRSLWNDLFSQVFRALRVILNGFVAFAIACNRHRLSIYNHVMEFAKRLAQRLSYSTITARIAENNITEPISEQKSTPTSGDESGLKTISAE